MNSIGDLSRGHIKTAVIKRIQQCREEIRYHELMRDIFKNGEFDEDVHTCNQIELTRLTRDNPNEALVVAKARPISEQIKAFGSLARHDYPVQDYRPATTLMHVRNWLDKVDAGYTECIDIVMTPYFNGCRVEIVYQGGALHKAITKGGGIMGIDFTMNAYLIDGIPQQINETERVSIRGVVTSTHNHVWGVDEKRVIASSLINAGPTNSDLSKLVFVPDDWHIPGTTFSTKDLRSISQAWDIWPGYADTFPGQYKEIGFLEEKVEAFKQVAKCKLPIAGILFTVNTLQRKMELGYTSIYPEWAILLGEPTPDVKSN